MKDEHPIRPFPDLARILADRETNLLQSYRLMPDHIADHKGFETKVQAGGYGYRQILELVQNGADAILEESESERPPDAASRIDVVLSRIHLYVANTGAPITLGALKALLGAHMSLKRGNQIGRFGVGFKSLLRLEGRIDLFTKALRCDTLYAGPLREDDPECLSSGGGTGTAPPPHPSRKPSAANSSRRPRTTNRLPPCSNSSPRLLVVHRSENEE